MASTFESKNTILTKKLNDVVYELMVKTNSDMVYVPSGVSTFAVGDTETGGEYDVTLTERLSDLTDLLTEYQGEYKQLETAFNEVMDGSSSNFNSFKEVWDYVNVNGDPKSELIKLIDSKQDKEEGKGLSTHDLDDIMYEKLVNGYTREELDEKFKIIFSNNFSELTNNVNKLDVRVTKLETAPNIIVTESNATAISDYSCWYKIISKDS